MDNLNFAFIGTKKVLEEGKIGFIVRGSGVIVEGKRFVTCAHVYNEIPAEDKNSVFIGVMIKTDSKVKQYTSFDITLKENAKNDDRDLIVFEITDTEDKLAGYGVSRSSFCTGQEIGDLHPSEEVIFQGFPLANEFLRMNMGITLMAAKCIIGAVKYNADGKIDFILIDKAVNPGSSGSPVCINDKIIGLASATINNTHKIGEAIVNIPIGVGIVRTSNYILELL